MYDAGKDQKSIPASPHGIKPAGFQSITKIREERNMLNKMKIKTKILLSFLIIAIVFSCVTVFGFLKMKQLDRNDEALYQQVCVALQNVAIMSTDMQKIKLSFRDLIEEHDSVLKNAKAGSIDSLYNEISAEAKKYEKTITKTEEKDIFSTFIVDFSEFRTNLNKIEELAKASTSNALELSKETLTDSYSKVEADIQWLLDGKMVSGLGMHEASSSLATSSSRILIGILIIGYIFSIMVSLYISFNINSIIKSLLTGTDMLIDAAVNGKLNERADLNKINFEFRPIPEGFNKTLDALINPLQMAANYVSMISKGDIPLKITNVYKGDFNDIKNNLNLLIESTNDISEKAKLIAGGDLTVDLKKRSDNDELIQSFTDMVNSVAKVVSDFQLAANNISSSSEQMSSTAQEMSQGATEQASSAEEVSSAMEQMAANIQQNMENAQQTQKIALNAADGIAKVAEAAQTTLTNIQEIADKVSIIGEIARQTNILALNAAVEAARAGEHGKGFAVVAAEVRKLAERSQVSAVEIDTLTKTSVRATEDAGKLMASIVPEISKTARLVQEIAAASVEQNSGADQVNSAIQQLNQMTQHNAAASEEVATSSEELSGQADQLLERVRFFKLENDSIAKKQVVVKRPAEQNINFAHHIPKSRQFQQPALTKKAGFTLNMDKHNSTDSDYEKF